MPCTPETDAWGAAADRAALNEWIFSLPWVVERPYVLDMPGVRIFAVDCEPVGVRSVWLVTGLPKSPGIAVVVPETVAADLDLLHLAEPIAPMPAGHVLASVCAGADDRDVERVLLEAYSSTFA